MVIRPLTCLFEKPGIRVVCRPVLFMFGTISPPISSLDFSIISLRSSGVIEACLPLRSLLEGIVVIGLVKGLLIGRIETR